MVHAIGWPLPLGGVWDLSLTEALSVWEIQWVHVDLPSVVGLASVDTSHLWNPRITTYASVATAGGVGWGTGGFPGLVLCICTLCSLPSMLTLKWNINSQKNHLWAWHNCTPYTWYFIARSVRFRSTSTWSPGTSRASLCCSARRAAWWQKERTSKWL